MCMRNEKLQKVTIGKKKRPGPTKARGALALEGDGQTETRGVQNQREDSQRQENKNETNLEIQRSRNQPKCKEEKLQVEIKEAHTSSWEVTLRAKGRCPGDQPTRWPSQQDSPPAPLPPTPTEVCCSYFKIRGSWLPQTSSHRGKRWW